MKNRILWIEDDFYAIKGLVRPLENEGFEVDIATTAKDGYEKTKQWQEYDLLIVDVIVPVSEDDGEVPSDIQKWESDEEYVGIGIAKWLTRDLKVQCPVLLMSVVTDPLKRFGLSNQPNTYYLSKKGLLPSKVKEVVYQILGIKD